MLFVHISRDVLLLQSAHMQESIYFGDLDSKFPSAMVAMLQGTEVSEIVVINGPGGFASLRAGCLTINLLQMLSQDPLDLYDISKIAVYQYAYSQ